MTNPAVLRKWCWSSQLQHLLVFLLGKPYWFRVSWLLLLPHHLAGPCNDLVRAIAAYSSCLQRLPRWHLPPQETRVQSLSREDGNPLQYSRHGTAESQTWLSMHGCTCAHTHSPPQHTHTYEFQVLLLQSKCFMLALKKKLGISVFCWISWILFKPFCSAKMNLWQSSSKGIPHSLGFRFGSIVGTGKCASSGPFGSIRWSWYTSSLALSMTIVLSAPASISSL